MYIDQYIIYTCIISTMYQRIYIYSYTTLSLFFLFKHYPIQPSIRFFSVPLFVCFWFDFCFASILQLSIQRSFATTTIPPSAPPLPTDPLMHLLVFGSQKSRVVSYNMTVGAHTCQREVLSGQNAHLEYSKQVQSIGTYYINPRLGYHIYKAYRTCSSVSQNGLSQTPASMCSVPLRLHI